MFVVMSMM